MLPGPRAAALAWTLSVALPLGAFGSPALPLPPPGSHVATITAPEGVSEIPFSLQNGLVVLPLSVNGSEPLEIVLDTGMPVPGLLLYEGDSTAGLGLRLDPTRSARVGGAGGAGITHEARVAMSETLELPGLRIDRSRVLLIPGLEEFVSSHDGILGFSLFTNFVVELDFDHHRIRLHDPQSYDPPDEAVVLPLSFEGRSPHTHIRLELEEEEPFDAKVVVDLGASHALSLNTHGSDRIEVPSKSRETPLGRGLSGPVEGHVARIKLLQLGRLQLRNVVTSFPVRRHQNPRGTKSLDGNLGCGALRRFKTTFDYAGRRLVLEPNATFQEPFRFDQSGLRLAYGTELRVEHVLTGSPAEESGIEKGDVLTHLEGEAVNREDRERVLDALRNSGSVRLTLRRGEGLSTRTVELRPLI